MLKDKNIVVTGAMRGIGRLVVSHLSSLGANIIACSEHINSSLLDYFNTLELKNSIKIYPFESDFNNTESIKNLGKEILEKKIQIYGLVNIAGITNDAIFQMVSYEDFEKINRINVVAPFILTQYILKNMLRNKEGSIVNISSISALDGIEGQFSYSSSKAALIGGTKTLARELGRNNIRINCIAPGVINTEMNQKVPSDILEKRISSINLKRMGEPEEVCDLIAFLLSDLSSYITGQTIRIDGGMF